MGVSLNFDSFANTLVSGIKMTPPQRVGILVRVVGMTLEAKGLIAPVGSLCSVESQKAALPQPRPKPQPKPGESKPKSARL